MSRTALIVDDSASMRQMISFTLAEAGFEVMEGANGQEALEQLEAQGSGIHVIITDLNMPIMDGMTFIRQVRGRAEHRFTPILMLTTESQETKKKEGKEAGATGWIVKPFDPERLLNAIGRVLP